MDTATAIIVVLGAFGFGAFLWTLAEYLLHRFAMHHLHGKGIMSREHLEHHVHSSWHFDRTHLMSWAGMLTVGFLGWMPLGWLVGGPRVGIAVAVGWACGYFFYEYQHAVAHLRAPTGPYGAWVRRHHFHHHFGHPMANHGVTIPLWDKLFGTLERPETVRVPRRLALPWMLDDDGAVKPELADSYALVGRAGIDERQAKIDRARAFASLAPLD
ncbi:sterol desaturase family protein [Rhabdothermincola sp.]|uniref:sterol desaturase family protein n=1 Tax=Rhabdothermincola sp. TaxID=2820405 RepID=UPI002FE353EA